MSEAQFPAGDYDWRWTAVEYTTGPDQTIFELMILTESPTRDLWVDDVYMAPVDKNPAGQFYEPTVRTGLPPEAQFYPAVPVAQQGQSPAVKVRLKEDPSFGFDAKINWDPDNLVLDVDVRDPTASPIIPGKEMWYSDSIQIAIDTQPEKPKDGFGASCYELGFAVDNSSRVLQYAWYAGGVDAAHWPDLEAQGRRTAGGYHLTVYVPWKRLRWGPPSRRGCSGSTSSPTTASPGPGAAAGSSGPTASAGASRRPTASPASSASRPSTERPTSSLTPNRCMTGRTH